jgi:hypothetical protein
MQIVCSTTIASAQVMAILFKAGLRVLQDYQIRPALSVELPIVFSMERSLPDALLDQIPAITDSTIAAPPNA